MPPTTHRQSCGGFGRRLPFTFDYVDIGVRVAKAMSPTPVKTIWTRENDIQHDYYRPVTYVRMWAALDGNGTPTAWQERIVQSSLLKIGRACAR